MLADAAHLGADIDTVIAQGKRGGNHRGDGVDIGLSGKGPGIARHQGADLFRTHIAEVLPRIDADGIGTD